MSACEDPAERTALLELVERLWRELTLHDARVLSLENVEYLIRTNTLIKESLTLH